MSQQLRAWRYFELELKALASFLVVTNPYLEELNRKHKIVL